MRGLGRFGLKKMAKSAGLVRAAWLLYQAATPNLLERRGPGSLWGFLHSPGGEGSMGGGGGVGHSGQLWCVMFPVTILQNML